MEGNTLELPRLRAVARHALPNLLEATFVPLALFYTTMWLLGVWGALLAALAWSYGALLRRLITGQRVPGILVIGSMLLTVRTAIAFASESVFLYFLQPTLGTVMVATAFLVSVPVGQPLCERLARDFCPLPSSLFSHPQTRRVFSRLSLLWAFAYLTNATLSIWILVNQPMATYLVAKQGISLGVTGSAIVLSVMLFIRGMRRAGVHVRFAAPAAA